MTLEYTPQLIDYRLRSIQDDNRHIVKGFLIGTKVGDKGWGVSKKTIKERVKNFIGVPFIVSPRKFDPTEHFLVGATLQEQIEKQKAVTRGKIIDIVGPLEYGDGTGDFYYDFKAEVTDKDISDALVTGRLPFATSPYIWPTNGDGIPIDPSTLTAEERSSVENWIPVHEALVTQGTFGDIAKIGKQCMGPQGVCTKALAGSSEDVAYILSSQIQLEKQQNTVMSSESNVKPAETQKEVIQNPTVTFTSTQAPIQTPKVEEKPVEEKKEVNEEFETLKRELEAERKINQKLLIKDKTKTLESVFTNFESEDVKKEIIKKYIEQDADLIAEVAQDVLKYGISKKDQKKLNNELAGSSKDEKETFPLAGNSKMSNRLNQEQSLTSIRGGIIQ